MLEGSPYLLIFSMVCAGGEKSTHLSTPVAEAKQEQQ